MKLIVKCQICCDEDSKYTCPNCLKKYCSLVCYKLHKEQAVCVKEEVISEIETLQKQNNLGLEENELLSENTLALLKGSADLKTILNNHHLRKLLENLNKSKNVKKEIEKCMQEPIFVEFANNCLDIISCDE